MARHGNHATYVMPWFILPKVPRLESVRLFVNDGDDLWSRYYGMGKMQFNLMARGLKNS